MTTVAPSSTERLTASLLYFLNFFTPIIGPAIVWYLNRKSDYMREHGVIYLNFLISYFLYQAFAGFLYIIAIGVLINIVLGVMMFVFMIIAGIYAYQGRFYKIPLVIRFFSL
ncbi:DUF4870 domain-containing protein [Jeotgalibacillus proteolyticus]|uniref:DUF4870 domain-containing protein n=1 Tax=Jeotgalibacillus proteolyticus TaxID=2082395 RepID=A0A2S5GC72_9BACL|nr:DUF4870 domain-containing protein [Jeotgalibacillus proteolyticus]PPA70596.1 DUF4870 domain-containing protein [Jeotgalibacillus proteolyticus]